MVRKVISYALVMIMAMASAGLIVNRHYCKNELKSTALFVKAQPCHSPKAKIACPMHSDTSPLEDAEGNCCDDKTNYLKSEVDQIHFVEYTDLSKCKEFNLPAVYVNSADVLVNISSVQHYLNYKPPLIVCDLPLRLQTLLC